MMGERLFDAETGTVAGHNELGRLPDWDLSDLYAAPDAPELKRDTAWLAGARAGRPARAAPRRRARVDWLEGACAGFAADYEGQLATLDAPAMLEAVRRYERIE